MSWRPTASLQALKKRADCLTRIRAFFSQRRVLEVDTPLLGACTVTDPYIESIAVKRSGYLQTSPEYYMKRLLANGVGDCYQICKAFRLEEKGARHNPEFTLLEWYRQGFDFWQLMDEVADLIEYLLGYKHFEYLSYREAFLAYLSIDPLEASKADIEDLARQAIDTDFSGGSKDDWLNLLMSHTIEPCLGKTAPVFIYDYPPSQAALAKLSINESGQRVASRFELYINGLELANGFDELIDPELQLQRFEQDNLQRKQSGLEPVPIDQAFISALSAGLPECSGVALGLDRLLMIMQQTNTIDEVISFCDYRGG